ncbi:MULTISPECIES: PQQ-binding-like beta-propeller repeat protein [Haloarcula]|uniref:PQQ-binding-like beta-propeller repeat protein n=1 Tax=Haloarcula argentinensis TaxID=43776 RepID=A0A830FMA5_HALAR|nr:MULTISPECIES: PQQ-binding-like beta-propeller repeat protein [Haloarcula]EMA26814.1 hypothetical protein C443_00577 [Haloarcula argentinensis DSM 12282]MDS0255768.1 PQQ-binding-like beta-propeller repeat protein [Haloarcula argentinensis]GGM51332.1 hypothetical protein GCM10009006_35640 [Haloarcula argentinensis]
MTIEVDWDRISINGEEIVFQYPIGDSIVADERVILRTEYQNRNIEGFDFHIKDQTRNVISVTPSGEREWVIESVQSDEEDAHHYDLWTLLDRYLTQHTEGNFEFDPETGDILNKWPHNQLPIADRTIELSGEITRVVEFDTAIFLRCKQATHTLYAFEADGTERWRSDAGERRGTIFVEDGELWEQTAVNRTTDHRYRLDPDTGDRYDREVIDTGLW